MGLDQNRFVEKKKALSEFICSICRDVIHIPKQINSSCEHNFCDECITLLVIRGQILKCPNDRTPIEEPYLRKPSRFWLNAYNKLQIKCIYSGCRAIGNLEDLEKHESSCEQNSDAIIICKGGCAAEMTRSVAKDHSCISHLKKLIDRLTLCGPPSEMTENNGSVSDEINSIKRQIRDLTNRLDETIDRLNEKFPKNYVTQRSCEARLLDLDSPEPQNPTPPIKPRRLLQDRITSIKIIKPKYSTQPVFH